MIVTHALTKRFGSLTAVDASISTSGPATSTASWAPTARARPPPSGCCSAWCWRPPDGSSCSASRCRGRGRVLPQVGALVEGPAAYGHLSGRANLTCSTPAARAGPRRRTGRARIGEVLEQVGLAGSRPPAGQGVLPRHAAAARTGRRAAAPARSCWCSTSRPTAWTRRASARSASCCCSCNAAGTTIFLSSHLLAEVEQLCTRVGVLDRGRLVLQDSLADAAGADRTHGRCRTPDVAAARALLDGRVEQRDGDRLLVRAIGRRPRSTRPGRARASGSRARAGAAHPGAGRAGSAPAPDQLDRVAGA